MDVSWSRFLEDIQIYLVDIWDPTVWFWNPHDSLLFTSGTGLFLFRVPFAVKRDRKPTSEDWGYHHPKQEEMLVAETGTACVYSLAHTPASWTTTVRLLYSRSSINAHLQGIKKIVSCCLKKILKHNYMWSSFRPKDCVFKKWPKNL